MSEYLAPVRDMLFAMKHLVNFDEIAALPGCEELSEDLADAILEEASKFAENVLSPLNFSGDQEGSRWKDKTVSTPAGFKEAYKQFTENGWAALAGSPDFGGQGLPKLISTAVNEMWKSANMAFSLCPMLTQGAIESLMIAGSDELKATYLPKMVSGEWTGTMNLTEPNAGSDLAAVKTRAEPQADGTYKIFGQKIFITYGEHDMAENLIHLVLGRTPTAPEGVKGISLFVVPKFMVNSDGSLGDRNDAYCVSIEHKLGIHASPTAVMSFGDHGGGIGYLVGEENRGLEYMFIMMNAARFAVGMEGVALSERAYQRARDYARDRIQGPELGSKSKEKVAIIRHPDVRRMLMSMRSQTEAMRGLAYVVAAAQDMAKRHPDAQIRQENQSFADLMIPVIKGWCTETSIDVTSTGIQVHGGMGFIEETGAAQHLRDARITTIYEGTTAIQANDLIGRKMARESGATIKKVLLDMEKACAKLAAYPELSAFQMRFTESIQATREASEWLISTYSSDIKAAHVGAVPFLKLLGIVAGGWQLARAAMISQEKIKAGEADSFFTAKVITAQFYAEHLLTQVSSLSQSILTGASSTLSLDEDLF